MKKDIRISELELSRETLKEMYTTLGLLDGIEFIYGNYQDYGYTNIIDFAIDEISKNSICMLLEHSTEYIESLKYMLDNAYNYISLMSV